MAVRRRPDIVAVSRLGLDSAVTDVTRYLQELFKKSRKIIVDTIYCEPPDYASKTYFLGPMPYARIMKFMAAGMDTAVDIGLGTEIPITCSKRVSSPETIYSLSIDNSTRYAYTTEPVDPDAVYVEAGVEMAISMSPHGTGNKLTVTIGFEQVAEEI